MRKASFALLLAMLFLLCGCGSQSAPGASGAPDAEEASAATTEATIPATVPADGDPDDVTCKGTYTGEVDDAIVATLGEISLTNEELQVWYWAEVARYQQEQHEEAPDFAKPLDTQVCQIDDSVASWQQYFLRQALNAWQNAQALLLQSEEVPLPTEEAYQPNLENHATYLTDQPATKVLYGYNAYSPNSMHQEYLDNLADTLEALAKDKAYSGLSDMAEAAFGTTAQAVAAYADTYNQAYMYFTNLSYYIEPTEEELTAFYEENQGSYTAEGKSVDIRHILLVPDDVVEQPKNIWTPEPTEPVVLEEVQIAEDGTVTCSEEAWMLCEQEAQELLKYWQDKTKETESTFAEVAHEYSDDTGTALDGGAYHGIQQGQLIDVLDQWCFDDARQIGDTVILRSDYGYHILYFCGSQENARAEAEEDYYRQQQAALIAQARKAYPAEITYGNIVLGEAQGTVSSGDLLYPDIAHERFPEIPLYLQQDYPTTKYGAFKITTHGCGITTMAMLASYMADEEYTPPEMCAAFSNYSFLSGTDGMLFVYEPSGMNFYLREKTYDVNTAYAALEEGQIVISIQHKGYWTGGGHYIALERLSEDGRVQVRDSNIYNYAKLLAHKEDLHTWGSITANGSGYWIYEDKITRIPACSRCGVGDVLSGSILTEDYLCRKCDPAVLRRDSFLSASAE